MDSFSTAGHASANHPAPSFSGNANKNQESSSHNHSSQSPQGSLSPQSPQNANFPGNRNSSSSAPPRIRRRNRMITSCLECRRRKLKCNKSHPCTNCVKFNRDCVFLAPALDQASQLKLTEIKEKVGSLERLLERDVARPQEQKLKGFTNSAGNGSGESEIQQRAIPGEEVENDLPGPEDENYLEPTPLAVTDAAYDDDGEDDDLLDLGITMGKMRMTERIGGFFRPCISQELEHTLAIERQKLINAGRIPGPQTVPLPPAHEYIKPGPNYIAPPSGFFFGPGVDKASLIDFLPSRFAADRLIAQYFTAVHPVVRLVHRPSFEKEYEQFWNTVSIGLEPPASVQAIVFACMFSGVVSMDEAIIVRDFGVAKVNLIDNFKLGTETALAKANFLRTTKVETLQAFVVYMMPQCRAEVSRTHSVLVGAGIRMAECMAIHRDGETYGLNPLECHIRRLIWHQLCFLDIRTAEAQGPRPRIRRDEYDTKLPLNVDEIHIHSTGPPPVADNRWTDVTWANIRFECNEMMRTIWMDRQRVERRKLSLTALLGKIEAFRKNMAAKYDHLIDERIPIEKAGSLIKTLMMSRCMISVLHRYHNSAAAPMPDRLKELLIAHSITSLEAAITMETTPELRPWAWYCGAYQQYHAAFLLLIEIYLYPNRKEADRIWNCLDYIFETDRSLPREEKGRIILTQMKEKTGVYQEMRKMRAPSSLESNGMKKMSGPLANMDLSHHKKHPQLSRDSSSISSMSSPSSNTDAMNRTTGGEFKYEPQDMSVSNVINRPDPIPTRINGPPRPDMVYAGVSNGESLWIVPNQESPESSDGYFSRSHSLHTPGTGAIIDDVMADIDWDEWNKLFPPDENTGMLDQPNSANTSPQTSQQQQPQNFNQMQYSMFGMGAALGGL